MKKALLVLITSIVLFSTYTLSQFQSEHITLDQTQSIQINGIVDSFYESLLLRTSKKVIIDSRMQKRNGVVSYINSGDISKEVFYALEYLVYLMDETIQSTREELDEALKELNIPVVKSNIVTSPVVVEQTQEPKSLSKEENETTEVNSPDTEINSPQNDEDIKAIPDIITSRYYSGNKTLLAGTKSEAISKIEIVAKHEDILLEELTITSSLQDFNYAVKEIHLYNGSGYLLGSERVSSNFVTFNNLEVLLPIGQTNLYIGITAHEVGYQQIGLQHASFGLTSQITKATGTISGKNVIPTTSNSSDLYQIVPVMIDAIAITDSRKNRLIEKRLYAGESNLGIIVISSAKSTATSTHGKEIKLLLEEISVDVQDYTTVGGVASTLKLKRVNGTGTEINGTVNNDGSVTFIMSGLGTESEIAPGTEEAYLIIGDIQLDGTGSNESITIDLKNTNTGGVIYKTTDVSSSSISALYLRYVDHDGIKIRE